MQKIYILIIFSCTFALTYHWLKPQQSAAPTSSTNISDEITESNIEVTQAPNPVAKKKSKTVQVEKVQQIPIEVLKDQSEDPSFLPFDIEGNLYIENVLIDDEWAIAHGDVLVGSSESIIKLEKDGLPLKVPKPRLWEDGVIPFTIDPSISDYQKNEILIAVSTINKQTVIKFEEAKSQEDKVLFKSGGTHCYSYVGRIGGTQDLVLGPDCKASQILHEMLHALGFYHEQSRPDRDEYIQILWENIEQKYFEQFKKVPPLHSVINDSNFDYQSIMLYPSYAFSIGPQDPSILTIDGQEYSPLKTLSTGDVEKIKILYESLN